MVRLKILRVGLLAVEMLLLKGPISWAAEVFISKIPDASGNYCFLKFPAIREDTLFSRHPVLKDLSTSDIISFHGRCDYDPLGRDAVLRQRADYERRRRRLPEGD
jgi:hypothetical protein